MQTVKLTKQFDHFKRGEKMTSYPAGYEGDMPQEHYDAAVAAGVVEGKAAQEAAPAKDAKADAKAK